MIEDGDNTGARTKLQELNAKNLQIGTLKDMLAVTKGEKHMYNQQGERVSSFTEADFIVPSDKQLVKEGNEFYLLDQGKSLNDSNRDTAKQDFLRAQSEMTSVKNLIDSNRTIETSEVDKKIANIAQKIEHLQQQKSFAEKNTMGTISDTHDSDKGLDLSSLASQQDKTQTETQDDLATYKH
ncbi:hypothetical protein [Legionella hackeliae]|uniref:LidA long coiled-coil domain-containing protein n=1 Tax=Legionella hackeliae TaxID=449 RepID=A0A0A8UY12_LEGHA|nr:hypothetical protein [Legionella hackeliae]KTD12611.1 Dot/Icm system substrate protein LidA [Legionella hackeliae]CEK12027.1 protein of unknown function [Legionella hackeliae]STX48811.1 Dot/Icm system substrate protein LidA [Legionella hackeliae]